MQKRISSFILAFLMILTLLPPVASAADKAELKVQFSGQDTLSDNFNFFVFNHVAAKFCLVYSDNRQEPVSPDDLIFPDFVKFEGSFDGDMCYLSMQHTGEGVITYEKDGTTYTMPVTVVLPSLGAYSSSEFTEENLIESFTLTDSNSEFYLAIKPEMADQGFQITDVVAEPDTDVHNPSITTVADVSVCDGGRYAAVKITEPTASGNYLVQITVSTPDPSRKDRWAFSIFIANDLPSLYYCHASNRQGKWELDPAHATNTLQFRMDSNHFGAFFYGSGSAVKEGKAELVSADTLSFPAYLDVTNAETFGCDIPGVVCIQATRFGEQDEYANISYERDGSTFTISAETVLPTVGFYTEPAASKSALIYSGNSFTMTEEDRTVYLCVDRPDRYRIVGINRWENASDEKLFDITEGNTGDEYLAFTLKDGESVPSHECFLFAELQDKRSGNSWSDEASLFLKSDIPSLMYRQVGRDNMWDGFYVPEDAPLRGSMFPLSYHDSAPYAFYYGTEENYVPVSADQLSSQNGSVSILEGNGAILITGLVFEGEDTIIYTNGDISAKMHVSIQAPYIGLYSSEKASAETYLGSEVSMGSANDAFYVIKNGGPIGKVAKILHSNDPRDRSGDFEISFSKDGSWARFAPKAGILPQGGEYDIFFSDGPGKSFTINRTDLPALDTPSALEWHKFYFHVETSTGEQPFVERMGAMSFKTGTLLQNDFSVEIYSAANSYTVPLITEHHHSGSMKRVEHLTVPTFIYSDLPSGTYKFRVRFNGDGTNYRSSEWSEFSEAWTYTRPSQRLAAPDPAFFAWVKQNDHYASTWKPLDDEAAGYYQVLWYVEKQGHMGLTAANGDIPLHVADEQSGMIVSEIDDSVLFQNGNAQELYFRVRAIPYDITKYRISKSSDFSEPFDLNKVTVSVNDKLDSIIKDTGSSDALDTIKNVQEVLKNDTADLHTAMAADLANSGGPSSGTLEKIEQLEEAVSEKVEKKIEADASAPQEIRDIADDITMTGATLNVAPTGNETDGKPSVTLELAKPKEGIVIDAQQHNAVQFSMKLSGAVGNDEGSEGQQLIVPIVIRMPVPERINPSFLVILHKHSDGSIEQIRPSIFFDEAAGRSYALFVVSSFSDFAFVEYNFGFASNAVTKYTNSAAFTMAATGNANGSKVTYTSSDPAVAEVDAETGLVTIRKAGKTTITATASATEIYPETQASYELTVKAAPSHTSNTAPVVKPGTDDSADAATEKLFSDVPKRSAYFEAIKWAVESGITNGTGDGTTFSPNEPCTRAQMAMFLWRAAKTPESKTLSGFTDVSANAYYAKAVAWAVENGITNGTGNGSTFSPDEPCTRAQMVVFLCRLANGAPKGNRMAFTDVNEHAYYVNAVLWAVEAGITNGTGNGTTFSPNELCTRAQMVTFLYRYFVK